MVTFLLVPLRTIYPISTVHQIDSNSLGIKYPKGFHDLIVYARKKGVHSKMFECSNCVGFELTPKHHLSIVIFFLGPELQAIRVHI